MLIQGKPWIMLQERKPAYTVRAPKAARHAVCKEGPSEMYQIIQH